MCIFMVKNMFPSQNGYGIDHTMQTHNTTTLHFSWYPDGISNTCEVEYFHKGTNLHTLGGYNVMASLLVY